MKISSIFIVFYIIVSVVVGMAFVGFSLHLIELEEVIFQVNQLHSSLNGRIALGATGASLVLLGFLFAQTVSSRREREKTIAFDNPSGQVTITLFAVEDLIRRLGLEMPEVKELRPDVVATKKRGLQVKIRLILKSAVNIPEFTTRLQDMVQHRIHETLGVDEEIAVTIHIAKILTKPEKIKQKSENSKKLPEIESQEIHAPYQGL
ncbi:alkaline shock response membrane anchor protein AmaP [Thermoproteota archaeon]